MKSKIKMILTRLYLMLSDCDGMCNHCNEELKLNCNLNKNKDE